MALTRREVIIAAFASFVAWGFVIQWAPALRYVGYALVVGAFTAVLAVIALTVLTSKGAKHEGTWRSKRRRTAAFVAPDAWKAETTWLASNAIYQKTALYPSSFVISDSIDELLDLALRDFVRSWYSNITRSPNFTNSIDTVIRAVFVNIRDRISGVDIVDQAVSRIIPIITGHLKDFYDAERAVRGKNLNRNVTESEELDLAIAGKYREGKLHPAASLAYSDTKLIEQEYLRKLMVRLMPEVLPESIIKSRAVSVLVKEIVSCAVLSPVMQILSDPDMWNQLMEAYGKTMLQDRKSVRKLRAALDEHASPAPKPLRPLSFAKLSPNDDERKFERFVRSIRQCNNLSDARRFRSEVASQLKRESMMEAQDLVYIRRLDTGKRILDQQVAKLSAVGGTSSARVPQPDFRNGHAATGIAKASITEVLHDAAGLSYFMEYMDRQRLMTLVQFWIVVDGFRNPLEDDNLEDETFSGAPPKWTDSDRSDLAQINEAYLSKPELKVSGMAREEVRSFLKAGRDATPLQYLRARSAVLRAQTAVLEKLRDEHFPGFKNSDLYYKYITSDDSSSNSTLKTGTRASKNASITSIPESPAHTRQQTRMISRKSTRSADLRRNAASSSDLNSAAGVKDEPLQNHQRRSFDHNSSSPLFDDDIENEPLARSTYSLENTSTNGDHLNGNQEQMVQAMEAALNDIITDNPQADHSHGPLFDPAEAKFIFNTETYSPQSSVELRKTESIFSEKERERPNLASLGLVNTASRIGVFSDDDLFGDEDKFSEDEYADPEDVPEEKGPEDEIHQAAPGDLGLAEAISALTNDIEKLAAQDSIVDTLTRKAELTNNVAELRILGKSKSSLQREIRRKELQRQQYIVQESDNSLYGRASVEIKSIMVGKEDDGQEFALYVIEVQRKAGEHMSAASWAIARRYSEFHELHQRLRSMYPAVRNLDFPRRRLVMKLQRDFLHKRRISLERYLRELLRLPAVCRSRDLRAFLSQQAIISTTDEAGRDGERRDIVSRIYNSVTDGMDDFLGNIPVLDQLSLAGQNLISAATSQFNTMPTAVPEDAVGSAETQAELEAFENKELEPFVKPICDLFLEVFELNRGNNWLRGRAVVVVLHQLLGGTVERRVRDSAKSLVREDALLKYIALAKEVMWPGGQLRPAKAKARTPAEKSHSRAEASVMLATLVPDLAGNVVGRANAQAASRRIFATVNNPRLNTHLAFTLLDELVSVLFGDGRGS